MLKNKNAKLVAAVLALVMIVAMIPAGYMKEVQAASKNKVMEANVDFKANAQSGDESGVYFRWLLSNDELAFGKTYSLNMKIYVPATYMKSGELWIKPSFNFWTGEDLETYAGWGTHMNGYSYNVNSKEVTKYNDFYVINASMPIDENYVGDEMEKADFPEGNGQIVVSLFISGWNKNYKGSIYFDDVEMVMDDTVIASADYENGKAGYCNYSINESEDRITPKVVSFSGKALEVSKTSLTVKKGKKVTIKATTTPTAKVTYTSSNKKVATVTSKGVVKGIKKGKATITVKANGKTIKVKVTVK